MIHNNRRYLTDNLYFIFCLVIRHYGKKSNLAYRQMLKNHPFFPSYLSLNYTLKKCGIDNCVISANMDDLQIMPTPFIARLTIEDGIFIYIENINETNVTIKTGNKRFRRESLSFLNNYWDRTLLILDSEKHEGTHIDKPLIIRTWFNNNIKYFLIILIAILFGVRFHTNIISFDIYNVLFTLTALGGIYISLLFLIQEHDKKNGLINKVCHSSKYKNRDCSSILDSSDSRFIGLFKWSDFGMVYFLMLSTFLLTLQSSLSNLFIVLFSLLASLYIPYSLFYQKFISRKWCMLCLLVQLILFLNLLISIVFIVNNGFNLSMILGLKNFLPAVTVCFLIVLGYSVFKIVYNKVISSSAAERKFRAIKNDEIVVENLFNEEHQINTLEIPKITLSPEGANCITIIFNTTCNPCINEVRKVLNMYISKKDTRIDILFFLDKSDIQSVKVAYSLLYYRQIMNDKDFFSKLKEYIKSFPKSLKSFSQEQFFPSELKLYEDILLKQYEWCVANNITSTPTIYYNNRQVPKLYDIQDLDYMCE